MNLQLITFLVMVALEAGDGHAGDLKPLYLFHSVLLYAA